MEFIKKSELKKFRKKMFRKQKKRCPVLGQRIRFKDSVVDHQHKTKSEKIGENGAGMIRGVLHFQANVMEGKISNGFKRYGLHKLGITLPQFLRNLADYLEQDPTKYIHPNEIPKARKIGKLWFNKISKAYSETYPNRKKLIFPKSKKLTKKLEKLAEEFNIKVKYLKN